MANIGWDESTPADTESAGLGDDRIRSLKTSLRQGLAAEHTWPSAGGDSGIHLLGSARAFFGTQSTVSSSGTDGRLMQTSDSSQMFHVGSGGTSLIGGPNVISLGTFPGTAPQRAQWVEEVGLVHMPSGSGITALVTFPNSGFSGVPYVWLTQNETDPVGTITGGGPLYATSLTKTSFIAFGGTVLGGSGFTVAWRSLGTRTL